MGELLDEGLVDSGDEVKGVKIGRSSNVVCASNADGQVLGHIALLDGLDGGGLQLVAEVFKGGVVIEFSSVEESSGPGEDGCDRVS